MLKTTVYAIAFVLGTNVSFAQDTPEPPYGYEPHLIQSLFTEDHRNNDYNNAIIWGRYLVQAHPKEMESFPGTYRGDRNFQRMAEIYAHMAGETNDPTERSAYLDSAQIMYNQVFEYFSEDEVDLYRWHQRRGRFLQENASHIDNGMSRAYEDYYAMFQMDPERATTASGGYYVQITLTDLQRSGEQEKALQMMDIAEPYASNELLTFFDQTRNALFTDPSERIAFLEERHEDNPEDLGLMEELKDLHDQVNNNDQAKHYAMMLYERNPTYENIMWLVDDALSNAEYNTAIDYLKESIDKTDDVREQRAAALQISDNYLNLRELEEAREYALQASQLDPNWGQPYLKIAEIYGQAVSMCAGSEMSRQDRVVYWLVLDYLDQARNVDPGTSRAVNRLYSTYQSAAPSREDRFYQNWDAGDTISVDGSLKSCYAWIGEDTTIRDS